MPTIGELGIMGARMKEINDSLDLIGEDYALNLKRSTTTATIYSCNEVWNDWPVSLFLGNGILNWDMKNSRYDGAIKVRAFLAI